VTVYAKPIDERYQAEVKALLARVKRLEQRTACIDSGMPVAALPAVIDPAYASGDPKALVNGSATLTGPYNHLASYTPAANDQVLVLPIPLTAQGGPVTSYVVLGKTA